MIAHAVGLLVKDRWELTQQTLESIYYSDQPKATYHLYIIDNGSNEDTSSKLKEYVQSGLVPVKNLIHIPGTTIPVAWNLFFMLASDYSFVTKLDNDVILHNTLRPPAQKRPSNVSSPDEADPLAGAPRSKGIVRGVGQTRRSRRFAPEEIKSHSAFLQHMEEFGREYNVGLVGLVSVPPKGSFSKMFSEITAKTHEERPFLASGCIQISRDAFQKLGYLDERLVQNSFRDYSQRAIRTKINIGYHPYYGLLHAGAPHPTKIAVTQQQFQEAELALKSPQDTASTQWLEYESAIKSMCEKHKIVSIG